MKLILSLFFALILFACDDNVQAQGLGASQSLSIVGADGAEHDFNVELAITPQQQIVGLMNRTHMAADAGMLFYFGEEQERAFWMKNTLIPLDMIFIRKDGVIHSIHENAQPNDLTSVPSNGPVAAVLELNGGMTSKLGIKPGDVVHHVVFGN